MESSKHSYIISMSDVVNHPYYDECKDDVDGGLKTMLTLMGMDPNKNIEESYLMHRSDISGEVVECSRYVGSERTDDDWKFLKIKASGALV